MTPTPRIDAEAVKRQADLVRIVEGAGVALKRSGAQYNGKCPFHEDSSPSFSVNGDKGVFHCFGCDVAGDVFDFIGLHEGITGFADKVRRVADLCGAVVTEQAPAPVGPPRLVKTYPYTDENGKLLYEVCRYEPGPDGQRKTFKQRRPNGNDWTWGLGDVRRPLYHLPEVHYNDPIWWVEGEKDVESMEAEGFYATTASGGAKAGWRDEWGEALKGKHVFIVPDNDEPGRARALEIQARLYKQARRAVVVQLPTGKDVTDFFQRGGQSAALKELAQAALAEQVGLLDPLEIIERRFGYGAFLDPTRRPKGVQTGYPSLDKMTLGLHPGELVVLGARPAMGKTALALNIAYNMAKVGSPVGLFSLEMASEQLLDRLVCQIAKVDQTKFRGGWLNQEERHRVMLAIEEIKDLPLFIDDSLPVTLKSIHRKARQMQDDHGLAAVFIDYLQLMTVRGKENRNLEIGAITRGSKILAKELSIATVMLSQLSRDSEKRGGTMRPMPSDLRDSGSIEQDADMIWLLHRPEVYKPDDSSLAGIAEVIIAKQRNGDTGIRRLNFIREYTLFTERASAA